MTVILLPNYVHFYENACNWWVYPLTACPSGYSSVGRCNEYWRLLFRPPLGKKRRDLRSSRPCYQDCRHTGLLYASLICSNHRQLKGRRGWAPSQRTSWCMHMSYSFFSSALQ